MTGLSKSRIIFHRQCPKRLWLYSNRPDLIIDSAEAKARMTAGTHAGEIARSLYPDGVLIATNDLKQAIKDTADVLRDPGRPVFEATFQCDDVLIRADLLLPDSGSYRLAEVKSSTAVKDYHLADVAVQAWAVRSAGVALSKIEIAHIDRDFVYQGSNNYRGLFHHVDVTEETYPLEQEVPDWVSAAKRTLAGDEPTILPGDQCNTPFECPFVAHCSPPAINAEDIFPVEILPYGGKLVEQLRAEGFVDLRDVPENRLTKPNHLRVWRATKTNTPELATAAGEQVRALAYPRYYLDFETIQFVVPIWCGTRPYDQVPFQWSCHIETTDGVMNHVDFLAEGTCDPRRKFAESLIDICGMHDTGTVLVYNAAFERTRMQELASSFPDLAPKLNGIIARIVDLLPVAREYYYHPEMRGSWSIKSVLPTIAPELAYAGLAVADGGMAQEAFAEILDTATCTERREILRNALLVYCERDTLAMVKIAHYFQRDGRPETVHQQA